MGKRVEHPEQFSFSGFILSICHHSDIRDKNVSDMAMLFYPPKFISDIATCKISESQAYVKKITVHVPFFLFYFDGQAQKY